MNKQDRLSELFDQARNARNQTSFEEVKGRFLSEMSQPSVNGTTKRVFTFKNILLMSVAISGIITLVLLNFSNHSTNSLASNPSNIRDTERTNKAPLSAEKKHVSKLRIDKPKVLVVAEQQITPQPFLRPWNPDEATEIIRNPLNTKPITQGMSSFPFPKLTEKEIEENHKNKRAMLKALSKKDSKFYSYIPSGTFVWKNDAKLSVQSYYIAKFEVSNLEYRTFLFDLLIHDRKEEFLKAKPDQVQWTMVVGEGAKPMETTYFSDKAFDDYPVVNVSREGAEMYCVWLSQERESYEGSKKGLFAKEHVPANDIRLPYDSEWYYAASFPQDGRKFPFGDKIQNQDSCYLANFRPSSNDAAADGGLFTVKRDSYNPSAMGLYNLAGNAAEMVWVDYAKGKTQPGTMGGGWMSSEEALKLDASIRDAGVSKGHPNIGFRIVWTYTGQ